MQNNFDMDKCNQEGLARLASGCKELGVALGFVGPGSVLGWIPSGIELGSVGLSFDMGFVGGLFE